MGSVLDALDYDGFGSARYVVGTNAKYAIYVEYGTSSNRAQPYLRPAVESGVSNLDSIANDADSPQELAEALALRIEEEAKREAPVDTGNLQNSITAERLQ